MTGRELLGLVLFNAAGAVAFCAVILAIELGVKGGGVALVAFTVAAFTALLGASILHRKELP